MNVIYGSMNTMGKSHKRNLFWLLALSLPKGHPKANLNSSQNSRLVFRNLRANNRSLLLERLQNSLVNLIWPCEGWSVLTPLLWILKPMNTVNKRHTNLQFFCSVLLLICQPLVNGLSLPSSRWILLQPFNTRPSGWWVEGQKVGRNRQSAWHMNLI